MKLVYGVGVNDAKHNTSHATNGRRSSCSDYQAWCNMLERCYSERLHARQPTYAGVNVCSEWHLFTNFKKWFDVSYVDGWQLDKDLVGNGSLYSPDTCVFVPQWLNKFTSGCEAARGEFPVGVCRQGGRKNFMARCCHPFGKQEFLGNFATASEAHSAWKSRKLEIAEELKGEMDEIDARIYRRVVEIIEKAK